MLLYVPIFEVEKDYSNTLIMNWDEQEDFMKCFDTFEEAEEYVLKRGYAKNAGIIREWQMDEPYAYYKGEHVDFSARIMTGGTPTHGKW